jgi:hypothetical protein
MPLQVPPINGPVFAFQGGIHIGLKHFWGSNEEDNKLERTYFHNQQLWANHPTFSLSFQIVQVTI